MPKEFKFPDVGEGITEGEIVNWKVKEGDIVKQDQVLCEVETDKAVVEIPSPYAGKILKLHSKEGEIIKVGSVLITFGEEGEKFKEEKEEKKTAEKLAEAKSETEKKTPVKKSEKKSTSVVGVLEEAPEEERPTEKPVEEVKHEKPIVTKKVFAVPAVRRLAKTLGVDIEKVPGTGSQGRITEEDVKKFEKHGEEQAVEHKEESTGKTLKIVKKYDMWGYVDHIPLRGVRRATAKRMVESKTKAAHVTHMDKVDVTELVALRNREKGNAEKKGIKLTYMPFIVKAVIEGLKEHRYLNAALEEESEEIILKKYYNIGIAVDTPEGLMVPVVKGADKKSIMEISKEIMELAEKAKQRKLDLMDMKGGSFTITNIGAIGGEYATPIINYPEVGILATGAIRDEYVVINGKAETRKILPLSLSFDHRVLDGAEAARFVNTVKKHLEDPDLLLIEME